jgi:molybdopterin converting factor small subunit
MTTDTSTDMTTDKTTEVRLFAAAAAAAGTTALVSEAPTLTALQTELIERYPDLGPVLLRCSFLVDGLVAKHDVALEAAATVDVLPPFAGG